MTVSRLTSFILTLLFSVQLFAQDTPPSQESPSSTTSQQAVIKTSEGDIHIELFADKAPVTVANFLRYAREGHYNGTIFHRTIKNFMIQGGGFDRDFRQKPTHAPIMNEATNGLRNERGTLAMARTGDPHSATSQFFINVVNNDGLNQAGSRWGYAVFGRVTEGMDVVDKIVRQPTGQRGSYEDVPVRDILIQSVEVAD